MMCNCVLDVNYGYTDAHVIVGRTLWIIEGSITSTKLAEDIDEKFTEMK